ncbi:MAG: hypothetical protein IKW16_04405 [Clostridia bacterium]|nr:hypothetical protein [Clostridia bacterium]
MKKFSIKTLLAVVLVVVLVFSLVACGDKCKDGHTNANEDRKCDVCEKDIDVCAEGQCVDANNNKKCDVCGSVIRKPDGGSQTGNSDTAAFFQGLWDAAAPIGGTEIADTKDLAVEMGMSLALSNGDDTLAELGINVGLVLDRTTDGAHSAAKLSVANEGDNILSVYYFLDDPYVFYIDALDQSFKASVNYNYNEEAAAIINDAITTKLSVLLGEETLAGFPNVASKSIMDTLNGLVDDFGANWNLDAPINAITGLLGVNIGELLGSEDMAETLDMVNGILVNLAANMGDEDYTGIDTEALAESDAVILDLLKGVGPLVFREVKTTTSGNKTTSVTKLDLSEEGLIGAVSFLLNGLPMGLGQVVSELEEVSLAYTTIDNTIDSFGINVALGTDDEAFEIAMTIDEIAITGVESEDAASILGATKANYKPFFEVNTSLDIEVSAGALIVAVGGDTQDFAGTYNMNLVGQIDLMNEENNGTRMYATLKHNNAQLAALSFDGTALALSVDAENEMVQFIVEKGISELLKSLAFATQVDGQPDEWLRGLVLEVANAAFVEEFADAAALKDATSFTMDTTLEGFAITDISLADIKTHGARLIASLGIPGFEASADTSDVEENIANAWQPNIYTLLSALSEAIDGSLSDGLTAEIDNIGELMISLFEAKKDGSQTGPISIEELCYGNGKTEEGKKVDGLFTMVDGFDACAWATEIFGGCAWAGDDILVSLMNSGIEVELNASDLSGAVKVTNGSCYISIAFSAEIVAKDSALDTTGIAFPNVEGAGWYSFDLN